jgi:hypothetical protein
MGDPAYVKKLQIHSKAQKTQNKRVFCLENLGFLIPKKFDIFQRTLPVFQGWVRDGAGF